MFSTIVPQKKSDVIARELENMVVEGVLKAGQKLPSERHLAEKFRVSRPSIREAIQKLATKGLLESRHGEGTFVANNLAQGFSDPLLNLLASHPEAQYDLLEFRHALDGLCAYYAALRSTDIDRQQIKYWHSELQQCYKNKDDSGAVVADVEFHLAIAEASHNMVLLHMMRSLFELVRQHIKVTLEDVYPKKSLFDNIDRQHQAIIDAIDASDPLAAQTASHAHFAFVEEVLLKQGQAKSRLERSLKRIVIPLTDTAESK